MPHRQPARRLRLPFVIAALAIAVPASAFADHPPPPRTLTVTGSGEAPGTPDIVILSVGVETRGKTAGEALRNNNEAMRATLQRLKRRGIEDRDIQTSNLSVSPVYNYETRSSPPEITGFAATNTLRVRFRDLARAETLIDEAVSVGANRLEGLTFDFSKIEDMRNRARVAAVSDARGKAKLYAEAAGVKLGPVLRIHESGAPTPAPYEGDAVVVSSARAAPLAPGESIVSAQVNIVFAIE